MATKTRTDYRICPFPHMTDKLRWDRELGAVQSKKIALYSVDALIPVAILRHRDNVADRLLDFRISMGVES